MAMTIPEAVHELVERWRSAGNPTQQGIAWPRQRWIEAFPKHAQMLRVMPDQLDRGALRSTCVDAAVDADSAERAFVAVMAWGFGNVGYGPFRTRRVLTNTPGASDRLATVARTLADSGAIAAYRRFGSKEDCRLHGLGPAFGTKYLYFCQPRQRDVVALILDDLVSKWLLREARLKLNPVLWSEATYGRYLDHLHGWAASLDCGPDDLEYCIFRAMASERSSQWGAS